MSNKWLRMGNLLYRLNDDRVPYNQDEIRVSMANGSRDAEAVEQRAAQLLEMLNAENGEA